MRRVVLPAGTHIVFEVGFIDSAPTSVSAGGHAKMGVSENDPRGILMRDAPNSNSPHKLLRTCIHICIHICICPSIYVYYMYTYIYTYRYIYIYT